MKYATLQSVLLIHPLLQHSYLGYRSISVKNSRSTFFLKNTLEHWERIIRYFSCGTNLGERIILWWWIQSLLSHFPLRQIPIYMEKGILMFSKQIPIDPFTLEVIVGDHSLTITSFNWLDILVKYLISGYNTTRCKIGA